ncbi:MAG: S66 family peptidase [Candidatus Woesearchaeota archaeon]
MIPEKLKPGDEIRVIAPSSSMNVLSKEFRLLCESKLKELGLLVSYGNHVDSVDEKYFESASVESRLSDLHSAFEDDDVKGVLAVFGGFNANQLLDNLDYNLIRKNPKVFCGFSDITALSNAIFAKTGLVTYNGPGFSSFGMKKGGEYTLEYFKKCLFDTNPIDVVPSEQWSDDHWWENQEERTFIKNEGYITIAEGSASGKIIGGNLCTLNLLQGTKYVPDLSDSIIFIEDDYESKGKHFDRDFQSLIHQPGFEKVRGIVIGRFEKESKISDTDIVNIIRNKRLPNIPIISNVDFGHTNPLITFPIGGTAEIHSDRNIKIKIITH